MAKTSTKKKQNPKPSKKKQYERFQQAARDLGVDNEESARAFESVFGKLVPPKTIRARLK